MHFFIHNVSFINIILLSKRKHNFYVQIKAFDSHTLPLEQCLRYKYAVYLYQAFSQTMPLFIHGDL